MAQELHLIIEDRQAEVTGEGPVYLEVPREQARVLVAEEGKKPRVLKGVGKAGKNRRNRVVVQAVQTKGAGLRLLVLSPDGPHDAPHVNGRRMPPVALLGERDELKLAGSGDCVLHVTLFNRRCVGPAPAAVIGKRCKICRRKFSKGTMTYVCPKCGNAMHLEGAEKPENERLECALVGSKCPHCDLEIVRQEGYSYLPDFLEGR
jgi:hypothetical protein